MAAAERSAAKERQFFFISFCNISACKPNEKLFRLIGSSSLYVNRALITPQLTADVSVCRTTLIQPDSTDRSSILKYRCVSAAKQGHRIKFLHLLSRFARINIKRLARRSHVLGENVHPHLKFALQNEGKQV